MIPLRRLLGLFGCLILCLPLTVAAEEPLRYAGATTLQRYFMPEAARAFLTETGVRMTIAGGNTNPGLKALLAGEIDVAGAGRHLTNEEKQQGLVEHFLGWDILAVVVARDNSVSSLSMEQLRGIFAGDLSNWQAVGGSDQPIVVLTAPQGSGMRSAVQELILKERGFTPKEVISAVVAQSDQQVSLFSGAITAVSQSMIDSQKVKTIAVNGVEPLPANIQLKKYPLAKPLALVTRGQPTGALAKFIALAKGPRGQAILNKQFVAAP
jgi:phosphate transport system substrate-binding protein